MTDLYQRIESVLSFIPGTIEWRSYWDDRRSRVEDLLGRIAPYIPGTIDWSDRKADYYHKTMEKQNSSFLSMIEKDKLYKLEELHQMMQEAGIASPGLRGALRARRYISPRNSLLRQVDHNSYIKIEPVKKETGLKYKVFKDFFGCT